MNLYRGARNSQGSVNHAHCSVAVSRYLGSKAVKLFKVRMHGSDAVSTCCHIYTIEIKLTIAGSQVKLSPSATPPPRLRYRPFAKGPQWRGWW